MIEDIHWADAPSLETLIHLVLNAPGFGIGIITTLRSDAQSRTSAEGLNRERYSIDQELSRCSNFLRIELPGLSEDESASLLGTLTGFTVDATSSRDLYQLTKGSPLRLVDMARKATTVGDLQPRSVHRRLISSSTGWTVSATMICKSYNSARYLATG